METPKTTPKRPVYLGPDADVAAFAQDYDAMAGDMERAFKAYQTEREAPVPVMPYNVTLESLMEDLRTLDRKKEELRKLEAKLATVRRNKELQKSASGQSGLKALLVLFLLTIIFMINGKSNH